MKNHYRKTMFFAGILMVLSIGLVICSFWLDRDGNPNTLYNDIAIIGFFASVAFATVFYKQVRIQRDSKAVMHATPIIMFELSDNEARIALKINRVKANDDLIHLWVIFIGLCVLIAVTSPRFAVRWDLWVYACLIIAILVTTAYLIASFFHTIHFDTTDRRVILSENGIYVMGWSVAFTRYGSWAETEYDDQNHWLILTVGSLPVVRWFDTVMFIPIPENIRDKVEMILTLYPTLPS